MNFKEGFKRIFLAVGYLFFILMSYLFNQNENIYTIIFACAAGFYIFKGIICGANWIIAGFKDKGAEE